MDGFKLNEQNCYDVISDKPEDVYHEHLGKLYNSLAMAQDKREIYRYQGAIAMLNEVIILKSKALQQIEK